MGSSDRFITDARMLIGTTERDPAKLQPYYGDIERLIARCMDELYLLAVKKGSRELRAALADIEYRARLVPPTLRACESDCATVSGRHFSRTPLPVQRNRLRRKGSFSLGSGGSLGYDRGLRTENRESRCTR